MLNFKQYLLKENNSQYHATSAKFVVDVSFLLTIDGSERKKLEKAIKREYHGAELTFSDFGVIVSFDHIREDQLKDLHFIEQDLVNICHKALQFYEDTPEDTSETIDGFSSKLVFNGIPPYVVNYETVDIDCDVHVTGLTGLDKVIGPDIFKLTINNFENVKGHILSLAKLKCKHVRFHVSKTNNDTNELRRVLRLLKTYRPRNDLIAFQEELMDAGLGEYAKL